MQMALMCLFPCLSCLFRTLNVFIPSAHTSLTISTYTVHCYSTLSLSSLNFKPACEKPGPQNLFWFRQSLFTRLLSAF
ncbi:hypothetical protein F7725_028995 [Dissostichus mawsoni]|uniref:Secreted protein n=1 Tax=Dissostichus mawsoni TaxID=36200 RepID=A0A7J5XIM3_DISMA|nr:hypothetical protein F7725_028995 [Dissostichus mawsoni]